MWSLDEDIYVITSHIIFRDAFPYLCPKYLPAVVPKLIQEKHPVSSKILRGPPVRKMFDVNWIRF